MRKKTGLAKKLKRWDGFEVTVKDEHKPECSGESLYVICECRNYLGVEPENNFDAYSFLFLGYEAVHYCECRPLELPEQIVMPSTIISGPDPLVLTWSRCVPLGYDESRNCYIYIMVANGESHISVGVGFKALETRLAAELEKPMYAPDYPHFVSTPFVPTPPTYKPIDMPMVPMMPIPPTAPRTWLDSSSSTYDAMVYGGTASSSITTGFIAADFISGEVHESKGVYWDVASRAWRWKTK